MPFYSCDDLFISSAVFNTVTWRLIFRFYNSQSCYAITWWLFSFSTMFCYPSHDDCFCLPNVILLWEWTLYHNSDVTGGGGQGGRVPPRDFCPGKFCWRIGKKEAIEEGKRGENWEEKKENWKREGGKLEMEVGKVIRRGKDFFFFFCFSLLKTTEICFGSTEMEIFYTGKKHFTLGNFWKNNIALSEKYAWYAPVSQHILC